MHWVVPVLWFLGRLRFEAVNILIRRWNFPHVAAEVVVTDLTVNRQTPEILNFNGHNVFFFYTVKREM